MHWVIQKGFFRTKNFDAVTQALCAEHIDYTVIDIDRETGHISPEVAETNVYVCGAQSIGAISRSRGWSPGSFMNDNFSFRKWHKQLGEFLLSTAPRFGALHAVDASGLEHVFTRPDLDSKAFGGHVLPRADFEAWRARAPERLRALDVVVAQPQSILREYRLFFVDRAYVTGSLYSERGEPRVRDAVDPEAITFARQVCARWCPADAFVIDVGLTTEGYRVIEFNNINGTGFYAADVDAYVRAIQAAYAPAM